MDGAIVEPGRHKLDVDVYHRMGMAGILGEDDRIELIDGDLIDMAPIGQEHAGVVSALTEALFVACSGRAIVSPQNPLRLDRLNEPQPDLAVLKRRADFYVTGERAGPADVLLVVEVADSSLRFDRAVKLPLYARADIAELWIVDLKHRAIDVHRDPSDGGYQVTTKHHAGDAIALSRPPEIVVRLDVVFG